MRTHLVPHPSSRRPSLASLTADVTRQGHELHLSYELTGNISLLRIPELASPARADKLWEHTVFECFIRTGGESYVEFNFAPSGQWAAYRFARYRGGVTHIQDFRDPPLMVRRTHHSMQLSVKVDLSGLNDLPAGAAWTLAITSVIEDAQGYLSYWSLAHGPGKPDFHHLDGFVLEIAPEQT